MNVHVESVNDVVNFTALLGFGTPLLLLRQSECHVPLELSLATLLISENLHFLLLCVGSARLPGSASDGEEPWTCTCFSEEEIALGSDFGDTNKVQFFGLFSQSSHEDQSEGQGLNVVDEE